MKNQIQRYGVRSKITEIPNKVHGVFKCAKKRVFMPEMEETRSCDVTEYNGKQIRF